jgi:hypothetical protein
MVYIAKKKKIKTRVVDPDPNWESGSGSRGKKTKKFQWKKCTF